MEHIVRTSVEKATLIPLTHISQPSFERDGYLDCKESISCQCGIQNEIPIYRILRLHI